MKKCEHGKRQHYCRVCGDKYLCEHGRLRSRCKQCVGFITVAKDMHRGAKFRAKRDNLPFDITVEDILKLIGDGVCPVLGIRYNITSSKIVDASANLDKFIPSKGYTRDNCTVLSRLANGIKSNATAEQIYKVADWVKQKSK